MTLLFKELHKKNKAQQKESRVRLNARISPAAYDAIIEIQRRHRRQTGKALHLWQILDAAVLSYAKSISIKIQS